jgi:hypothetical protein
MNDEDRAREERIRDFEEYDLERAQAFVQSRSELAEKIYSQAIVWGSAIPARRSRR